MQGDLLISPHKHTQAHCQPLLFSGKRQQLFRPVSPHPGLPFILTPAPLTQTAHTARIHLLLSTTLTVVEANWFDFANHHLLDGSPILLLSSEIVQATHLARHLVQSSQSVSTIILQIFAEHLLCIRPSAQGRRDSSGQGPPTASPPTQCDECHVRRSTGGSSNPRQGSQKDTCNHDLNRERLSSRTDEGERMPWKHADE